MNFVKQYIIQCISVAANNLRLSSEKIEAVTILREFLMESDDLYMVISEMKKVTELSKFAIKVGDIHKFISANKIDFLTLSDNFKNHSHLLVRELSQLLEQNSPSKLKKLLAERVNDSQRISSDIKNENIESTKINSDEKKKEEVLAGAKEKIKLQVVDEIRNAAELLNKIEANEFSPEELDKHIKILSESIPAAEKAGLTDLTKMLSIFLHSVEEVKKIQIDCDEQTIEGMRACLIVAAAIARNKNVDVSSYQKKAEKFGERFFSNLEKGNE